LILQKLTNWLTSNFFILLNVLALRDNDALFIRTNYSVFNATESGGIMGSTTVGKTTF
jgi:hypothetical protein